MKKLLKMAACFLFVAVCMIMAPDAATVQGDVGTIMASAASTSVKSLAVGKSYTVKGYAKVKASKTSIATTKKKSSGKYTVKAKKKGTTTLKCYDASGKLVKTIYLIVTNSSSFQYDTSAVSLTKGTTETVKATVQKGCTVKYSSSKKSVATVNSKGKITAKAVGSATISAKVYYKGKLIKTLKKKVSVVDASASSFALNYSSKDVKVGKDVSLVLGKEDTKTESGYVWLYIEDTDAYKWSVADSSVAAIKSYGSYCTVTGKAVGSTTVTLKMKKKGVSLSCEITVYDTKTTIMGVTFDWSEFSDTVSVTSSFGEAIGLTADSVVDPADVTYVVNGGNAELLYDDTCTDTYHGTTLNEQCEHGYYVPGWNNQIAYVKTSYDSSCEMPFRVWILPLEKTGSITVSAYYKGILIHTCTISVKTTGSTAVKCRSDLETIKASVWKDGMTATEKLDAVASYISENYPYTNSISTGYDCIAGARAIVMAARDMGYTAYFYMQQPWEGTTGHIYYNHIYEYDEYWVSGHVYAVVVIDGTNYRYDVQGYTS